MGELRRVSLLINSAIGFYKVRNAGNPVKVLVDSFTPKAKVKRNRLVSTGSNVILAKVLSVCFRLLSFLVRTRYASAPRNGKL